MEKKFELTDEIIYVNGRTLHRIRSLKDFNNVKKGDLGGFIEKEDNLSHKGKCWIYNNACVCDNACVCGDASVCGNTYVYDKAHICDNACVCGDASVCGYAYVYGNAYVCGNVSVSDKMHLSDDAYVKSLDDICYISSFGSKNRSTTFFKCKDGTIKVNCGCFSGTLYAFYDKVKETHGDNVYAKEYLGIINVAKIKLYR